MAHRLAFLYMEGHFPSEYVEHKDEDSSNNAWVNLVPMTEQRNAEKKRAKYNEVQDRVAKEQFQQTHGVAREQRARFSHRAVNQAVEEFIKNKTLVNGVYV